MSGSGFLDVNGGRLYYEVEGDGHTLLMVHGGLGIQVEEPERFNQLVLECLAE